MIKVTHIYERTEPNGKVEIVDTPDDGENVMTVDQLIQDFFTFVVACTYERETVIDAMEQFVKDYKDGWVL